MTKTRKKPITNKEILIKLFKAGYKTNIGVRKETDCFSTKWSDIARRKYYNMVWKTIVRYERNYMIPLDVYKQHINKRFKPAFKIGTMVRVNDTSSRERTRNKWNQNVGDSQDFRHLGIGSGKEYLSEDMRDALGGSFFNNWRNKVNSQILIGNRNYSPNVLAAVGQAKSYKHKGIERPKRYTWERDLAYQPGEFLEFIEIKPDGILGPKRLFNGFVSQVYVHFIYPRWNTKREARYEIIFETGAKGIWTNDYMRQVYDTDYEPDENLMNACKLGESCVVPCDHKKVHFYTDECDDGCFVDMHHKGCDCIYDYSRLYETTHGTALDLKDKD
jgi:hypothetical protein